MDTFGIPWMGYRLLSTAFGLFACTPKTALEPVPEILTEVVSVPKVMPLDSRGMRFAVTPDTVTVDLRPLAASLNEQERRSVRKAMESVPATDVRIQEGGSCKRFHPMIDLAQELGRTEPLDIEVHPDVTMLGLANAMHCAGVVEGASTYRFVLRGPEGLGIVDLDQRMGPVCRAEDEMPRCAQPFIIMQPEGLQVIADAVVMPTESDCIHGVLKERLLHEPPHRPAPPWAGKVMLSDNRTCPTVPASVKNSIGALMEVSGEMRKFGPGCPASRLVAAEDMKWSQIAPVLSSLRAALDFKHVSLSMAFKHEAFDCGEGMIASDVHRSSRE